MDLFREKMDVGGCFGGHSRTLVDMGEVGLYFSEHLTFRFMGVKLFVSCKRLSTAKARVHRWFSKGRVGALRQCTSKDLYSVPINALHAE